MSKFAIFSAFVLPKLKIFQRSFAKICDFLRDRLTKFTIYFQVCLAKFFFYFDIVSRNSRLILALVQWNLRYFFSTIDWQNFMLFCDQLTKITFFFHKWFFFSYWLTKFIFFYAIDWTLLFHSMTLQQNFAGFFSDRLTKNQDFISRMFDRIFELILQPSDEIFGFILRLFDENCDFIPWRYKVSLIVWQESRFRFPLVWRKLRFCFTIIWQILEFDFTIVWWKSLFCFGIVWRKSRFYFAIIWGKSLFDFTIILTKIDILFGIV